MESKKERNERLSFNVIKTGVEVGLGLITGHAYITNWESNDGISSLDKRKDIIFDSNGKPKLKSSQQSLDKGVDQ